MYSPQSTLLEIPQAYLTEKHLSSSSIGISQSTATLWVLCREMPPFGENAGCPTLPKVWLPSYERYHSYPIPRGSHASFLSKTPNEVLSKRDELIGILLLLCFSLFVSVDLNFSCHFQKLQKKHPAAFPLGNLQIKDTTFWIAGQGDMVATGRKTSLKSIGEVQISQKTKFETTLFKR